MYKVVEESQCQMPSRKGPITKSMISPTNEDVDLKSFRDLTRLIIRTP